MIKDCLSHAAAVVLCGDDATQDPGGGRKGGGGFGMQVCHTVIASIGDTLRACQAVVVSFRHIARMPGLGILPSTRAGAHAHEVGSAVSHAPEALRRDTNVPRREFSVSPAVDRGRMR